MCGRDIYVGGMTFTRAAGAAGGPAGKYLRRHGIRERADKAGSWWRLTHMPAIFRKQSGLGSDSWVGGWGGGMATQQVLLPSEGPSSLTGRRPIQTLCCQSEWVRQTKSPCGLSWTNATRYRAGTSAVMLTDMYTCGCDSHVHCGGPSNAAVEQPVCGMNT